MPYNRTLAEQNISKLIKKGKIKDKKIILFGANNSSKEINDYLHLNNLKVFAIIDNDKRKRHQYVSGIKTYLPEEILGVFDDNIAILIASEYHKEMCEQLKIMGYIRNKHIYIIDKIIKSYDTSLLTYLSYIKILYKGFIIYKKIRKKYGNNLSIFLCPYAGTGDIFLIGLFMSNYLEIHNINDYIITVVGKACARVDNLFHFKNVILLDQESSDCVVSYVRVMGYKDTNVKIMNDCYRQTIVKRFRGYRGLTLKDMFQYTIFGIDKYTYLKKPDNQFDLIKIKTMFDNIGMIRGRTVILSPYSNTVTGIPDHIWIKLVQDLIKLGYTVCTNSAGLKEPEIKGTSSIFFSFEDAVAAVEYAGFFIGMRSGLCDIISNSNCNKIILYPSGKLIGASTSLEYFGLNNMGLAKNAVEIEYDTGKENLIENIISIIINMERDISI